MTSQLCAQLFFIFTFLVTASCSEFHAGHEAVHQTAIWRRARPEGLYKQKKQVAISAHDQQQLLNTELQDTKIEYIGSIGVGTNAEGNSQFQARVVFDTGSTNMWVASTLCKTQCGFSENIEKWYNPEKSLTQEAFTGNVSDIDVTFGSGKLSGLLHVDDYRVGPMVVKQQPFAMIKEMYGSVFATFPFEGILGLGFKSMSFNGIEPFFDRVIRQRLLKNNEFAFFLSKDGDKPSAVLWGGIDKDLYDGPIRMFPVVQPHYWTVELVDFRLGNTSMIADAQEPVKKLIVDSGTSHFTVPSAVRGPIMQKLPTVDGAKSQADCSEKAKDHPPLTYVLRGADGQTHELVVTSDMYMIFEFGTCSPAIQSLNVAKEYGPAMLLGEVFMRHFFTVFSRGDGDEANAKIGIAHAKTGATPKVKSAQQISAHASDTVVLETDSSKAEAELPLSDRKRIIMAELGNDRPRAARALIRREFQHHDGS